MVFQGFLPVDKDIIKSKCHRNVRSGIKNAAEMLQVRDISAENLPPAALSAHCCGKIYTGQPGMSLCHVLSYREHNGKFRTLARLRNHFDIAALPHYNLAGQIQANAYALLHDPI